MPRRPYLAGDWRLPKWWTSDPPVRTGYTCSYQELVKYYSSPFVVNVLGHKGGITTLPTLEKEDD